MAFRIHEPVYREQLEVRPKPYYVRLVDGLHIGYRKGKTVSRWVVRRSVDSGYRTRTVTGVEPGDRLAANGVHIVSFQQMVGGLMAEPTKPTKNLLSCSFCAKTHKQVAKLVAGPGVFICDKCVELCRLYIDYPDETGRLLIKDGKAVLKNGKPVFVPVTAEERRESERRQRELLDTDGAR